MDEEYIRHAHRVQTAIAVLMGNDPNYKPVQTKHMRTGIDMSKSDMCGLVTLLIEKGLFTPQEYVAAITTSAKNEADSYEKTIQSVLGHRGISTG